MYILFSDFACSLVVVVEIHKNISLLYLDWIRLDWSGKIRGKIEREKRIILPNSDIAATNGRRHTLL